jgi:hypothetical protein
LTELHVREGEAWMAGDYIVWDILAPRALCIRGIRIRKKPSFHSNRHKGDHFPTINSPSGITTYTL